MKCRLTFKKIFLIFPPIFYYVCIINVNKFLYARVIAFPLPRESGGKFLPRVKATE